MAFKMKGPSTHKGTKRHTEELKDLHYKQLKVNRNLDKTNLPDGRPGSSPTQLNPSFRTTFDPDTGKTTKEQISDTQADMDEKGKGALGPNQGIVRTGGSSEKHLLKEIKKKSKQGKGTRFTREVLLPEARKEKKDNPEAERKQHEINRAAVVKSKKSPTKSKDRKMGDLGSRRPKKETLISKKQRKQKKSSRIHGTGQKAEMERLKHRQLQKKFGVGGGNARKRLRKGHFDPDGSSPSPAKCPLIALAGPIMGAMASKKKKEE